MHFVKYYLIIRMMTKIHCHAFLGVNLMVLRDWLKPKFDKCWQISLIYFIKTHALKGVKTIKMFNDI